MKNTQIKLFTTVIILLFAFIPLLLFGNKQEELNIHTLPDSIINRSAVELLKNIKPIQCEYWQCIYVNRTLHVGEKGTVIITKGDSIKYKHIADRYSSSDYFLSGCHPDYCGYYIVAVINNKTKVFDNNNILEFINTIDNLEEMILTVNLHGFRFSNDTIVRAAFIDYASYYVLYLSELGYSTTYSSIKAILNKSGEFKVIDRKVLQHNDSIVHIP